MMTQAFLLYFNIVDVMPTRAKASLSNSAVNTVVTVLCWGVPALIVVGLVLSDSKHYTTKDLCWIDMRSSLVSAVMVPLALCLFVNLVVYLWSLAVIARSESRSGTTGKAALSFFVLLGLSWLLGVIVFLTNSEVSMYFFNILVGLQGVCHSIVIDWSQFQCAFTL